MTSNGGKWIVAIVAAVSLMLSLLAIVWAGGGDHREFKTRVTTLESVRTDHEDRLRTLEADRANIAVMRSQIEQIANDMRAIRRRIEEPR